LGKYQIQNKIGEKKIDQYLTRFAQFLAKFDQNWPIFGSARLSSQVSRDCETIFESRLARDHARLCHTRLKVICCRSCFWMQCLKMISRKKSITFCYQKLQNFLSHSFGKYFVQSTVSLTKLLKSWFHEIFFGEKECTLTHQTNIS